MLLGASWRTLLVLVLHAAAHAARVARGGASVAVLQVAAAVVAVVAGVVTTWGCVVGKGVEAVVGVAAVLLILENGW